MKFRNFETSKVLAVSGALLLAGCAAAPRVEVQRISLPVPVECREPVPERPVMPTEALRPGASLDDFARAAMAEIERREGFEVALVTALLACTDTSGFAESSEAGGRGRPEGSR